MKDNNEKKAAKNNKLEEIKKEEKLINYNKKILGGLYIGYIGRIILCLVLFIFLFGLSLLFFSKTINLEGNEVINYQESGFLDYKVYLKPNQFYETEYLDKNMNYIASLIKNINIDMNYQFVIDEKADMNFSYQVIGKLSIYGDSNQSKLYEKEYILKEEKLDKITNGQTIHEIKDNLIVDYDYYNELANSFKSTYGVDASSDLTVYIRINKAVKNESKNININESSDMSLTIPLTQKTLNIEMNQTGISNSNSIINESKFKLTNVFSGVLSFVSFVAAVASLLKLLELLFLMSPKQSKYDKFIKKTLTEYDRLIVETPTTPNFENKDIIKIKRIEELIDARDNLKRPIMYHNLVNHQKSYFYIESDRTIYLYVVKVADLEDQKEKKK